MWKNWRIYTYMYIVHVANSHSPSLFVQELRGVVRWEGVVGAWVRLKSTLTQEQRERIARGPGLEDFVRNAPLTPDHLKRKKGQRSLHNRCVCVIKLW